MLIVWPDDKVASLQKTLFEVERGVGTGINKIERKKNMEPSEKVKQLIDLRDHLTNIMNLINAVAEAKHVPFS